MRTAYAGSRRHGPPAADHQPRIEIAELVTAGLSNRQIADRLYISVRTTEGHLYRIFAKLGINSRDQLIHLLALNRFGSPDGVRT